MATVSRPRVERVFKIRGKGLSLLRLLWPRCESTDVLRAVVALFFLGLGSAAAGHHLADES